MITPAVPDPPEVEEALWAGFGMEAVAFDVGANCGQTLTRLWESHNLVVAFEPAVESFEYLAAHYGTHEGIRLENLAVSSTNGHVELIAAPSKIDTGQLVTRGIPGMEWSEESRHGEVRLLDSVTLDHWCDHTGIYPDFIKIDVEGHELEVLKGAQDVLDIKRPRMLIEIHSEELGIVIQAMLATNYRIEVVRHPHYAPGTPLWSTHFWLRCFPV